MRRGLTVLLAAASLLAFCNAPSARGNDAAALDALIDRHIQTRLDSEGVPRVPPAEDAAFLRRVHLDLHGAVPSAKRAARFLDDPNPHKRAQLIEELLASPRFGDHLAEVVERPIGVTDFLATVCTILEIDYTRQNRVPGVERPISIVDTTRGATVISELL